MAIDSYPRRSLINIFTEISLPQTQTQPPPLFSKLVTHQGENVIFFFFSSGLEKKKPAQLSNMGVNWQITKD